MSSVDLEALSDAELRQKCRDHGLPNVPITGTTRKLIIRKLENAMSNKGADRSKQRRETIHVANTTTTRTVEAPSAVSGIPKHVASKHSRRTIASTNITSTVPDLPAAPTLVTSIPPRRRSTQPKQQAPAVLHSNHSPVYEEEYGDDEDDDDVILVEAAERSEREASEFIIPRARRSVSLTKTGVVTTSYTQETAKEPPQAVKEITYEQDEGEDLDVEEEEEPEPYKPSNYVPVINPTLQFSSTQTTTKPLSSYEPIRSSTIYTSYDKTTESRTSLPSYGFSSKLYETSSPSVTSFPTRRVTSVVKEDEPPEAPYLSNFTRKLESIKAEQLRASKAVEPPRYAPIPRRDNFSQKPVVSGRPSFSRNQTVADSFKDLLRALDRKYNLKTNFFILLVVVLIIFVYIVFIQ